MCAFVMQNAALLLSAEADAVRSMLMEGIRRSLSATAQQLGVSMRELSSTFICVLTDGRQYLAAHLGDGAVLAERRGALNVLSFPQNGSSRSRTPLTTMPLAERYLRICRESCDDISIIWIMTDGAMAEVFGENYGLAGEKLSLPMIRRRLSSGCEDDATYGYISWREEP